MGIWDRGLGLSIITLDNFPNFTGIVSINFLILSKYISLIIAYINLSKLNIKIFD